MNEPVHFDAWLVAKLRADTGVGGLFQPGGNPGELARVAGVWSEIIPTDAALPAIRFTDLAPTDTSTFNGNRILVRSQYLVVVTGQVKDYKGLVPAADRLDEVLHKAAGQLASPVWVLSCTRLSPFKQTDVDGDVQFRHLGGIYQVQGHKE